MGLFKLFDRKDPKTELEGLKRAQAMLDERFQRKEVSNEIYQKQSLAFRERIEKCEKKMGIDKYDQYNQNKVKPPTYIMVGGFMFGDSLFKKVQDKTNVDKKTILELASKLQNANMKDEATLRAFIQEVGAVTGREVSKEKEDKLVNTIMNDKVPTDLDSMM